MLSLLISPFTGRVPFIPDNVKYVLMLGRSIQLIIKGGIFGTIKRFSGLLSRDSCARYIWSDPGVTGTFMAFTTFRIYRGFTTRPRSFIPKDQTEWLISVSSCGFGELRIASGETRVVAEWAKGCNVKDGGQSWPQGLHCHSGKFIQTKSIFFQCTRTKNYRRSVWCCVVF